MDQSPVVGVSAEKQGFVGSYRKVRAHFLCRQIAYALSNLGDFHAQWATPQFYANYYNYCHRQNFVVDRSLHRRLSLAALAFADPEYIMNFHTRTLWFMLESIPQDEQLLLVETFETYYGKPLQRI